MDSIATLKENCLLLVAKSCFRNRDGAMQVDSTFDSLRQIHVKNSFVSSAFPDTHSVLSDSGVNERLTVSVHLFFIRGVLSSS